MDLVCLQTALFHKLNELYILVERLVQPAEINWSASVLPLVQLVAGAGFGGVLHC